MSERFSDEYIIDPFRMVDDALERGKSVELPEDVSKNVQKFRENYSLYIQYDCDGDKQEADTCYSNMVRILRNPFFAQTLLNEYEKLPNYLQEKFDNQYGWMLADARNGYKDWEENEGKQKKSQKSGYSFKDKITDSLGIFGTALYYLFSLAATILPIVMIHPSFILSFLCFMIMEIFPLSKVVFWVWGLVGAINGPQDAWAIAYYILCVVILIPSFIVSITNIVRKLKDQ